jgi:hypothetical protein
LVPSRALQIKRSNKGLLLPGPEPRTIPLGLARGIKMHVDFAYQTQAFFGLYAFELNRHLRRLLRRGDRAFDVGAQRGYLSPLIARQTKAQVAAFECDDWWFDAMRRNFGLNPELDDLIVPVHGAVGLGGGAIGLDQWSGRRGFVPDFIKLESTAGSPMRCVPANASSASARRLF